MMSTHIAIRDALNEIHYAYKREIMKWYRIRRACLRRGHTKLAEEILAEIDRANRDIRYTDFRDWDYGYKYLFQTDRPAGTYHKRETGYYPGCYGDALDDC